MATRIPSQCPGQSLTFALQAIARAQGAAWSHDDLNAALGAPWLTCAVPQEPDIGLWPMYGRDAFLKPAARLFGLTVRDIHPPEAARGLRGSAEFDQHFRASYRPLIEAALVHGQPVLAWRGWAESAELVWGIITDVADSPTGFAGLVHTDSDERASREKIPLMLPPLQVYVVERCRPTQPPAESLVDLATAHARNALNNEIGNRMGLITGGAALEHMLSIVRSRRSEAHEDDTIRGLMKIAQGAVAGAESGERFVNGLTRIDKDRRRLADLLAQYCGAIRKALAPLVQTTEIAASAVIQSSALIVHLTEAMDSAKRAAAALARERGGVA